MNKIAYHFYHWLLIQVQLFFLPVIWQLSVILYLVLGRLRSKVMVLECCRKIKQNINQWIYLNIYRQKGLHFQSQQWLNQSLIRKHFARGREIRTIVELIELKSSWVNKFLICVQEKAKWWPCFMNFLKHNQLPMLSAGAR